MEPWEWITGILGTLLLLLLAYAVALVLRRRAISRHGGTFELSLRRPGASAGHGWLLGLGRYSGDRLEYFRIFSLALRPKQVWQRDTLVYEGWREPEGPEVDALYAGHVVVSCTGPAGAVELALGRESLMGLQSWLEARPPGTDWTQRPLI